MAERQADVVLLDLDIPGIGGLEACERLGLEYDNLIVIVVSSRDEPDYLRQAMAAGAKDYLIKPVADDDLKESVNRAYAREVKRRLLTRRAELGLTTMGKVIAVFSTKGGTGKTTLAVNIAGALQQVTRKKVIIADFNLQFGDVAVMLDIHAERDTSMLVQEEKIDEELISRYLSEHSSGLKVLTAPYKPHDAEKIRADHIRTMIDCMKLIADWVVIDTASSFRDIELTVLDMADIILLVTTPEITSLKDSKLCLEVMKDLEYPDDKVRVILNRSNEHLGISQEDIEKSLNIFVKGHVPSDGISIVTALNRGIPVVFSNKELPVSRALMDLACELAEQDAEEMGTAGIVAKIKKLFR